MSRRKSQNSILFLTTLGVYLGLVLVGATPVFGHAAATRHFEIGEEIEVHDDLDRKPNGCDEDRGRRDLLELQTSYLWFNERSIDEFGALVELFLDTYPESRYASGEFAWSTGDQQRPFTRTGFSAPPAQPLDKAASLDDEFIETANGLPGRSATFTVSRSNGYTDLRFGSRSIPHDLSLAGHLYSNALASRKCGGYSEASDLVYRNSRVSVEKNNLVISTRLPRGSLRPLFANDAK